MSHFTCQKPQNFVVLMHTFSEKNYFKACMVRGYTIKDMSRINRYFRILPSISAYVPIENNNA